MKLLCPRVHDIVRRDRLFQELDGHQRAAVTWVHAPAGAGKTVLLTSYLEARGQSAIWYTLDITDRDIGAFFHYARQALEHALGTSLSVSAYRGGPEESLRAYTRGFFEEAFAKLPAGTAWVFDDFQESEAQPLWRTLCRELFAVIPPHVRCFVASRVAPRKLGRFSASGALQVLTWSHLRFDEAEVRELARLHGLPQAGSEMVGVLERSQGWAVAVSMLTRAAGVELSAKPAGARLGRGQPTVAGLGNVFEFLASEVFEQFSPAAQDFLLRVALLPSFDRASAAAVHGRADVDAVFDELVADSLLLERYGESSYRLHDLFRAFLLERTRRALSLEEYAAVALRAATLLGDADQFQHAAELMAAASNHAALAELIEKHAPTLAARGQLPTLAAALDRLPEGGSDERTWLLYWRAVCMLTREPPLARALGEQALRRFQKEGDAAGSCLAWALIGQCVVLGGDSLRALDVWLDQRDGLPLQAVPRAVATECALSELYALSTLSPMSARAAAAAERAMLLVRGTERPDERVLMICCMSMSFYSLLGQRESAAALRGVVCEYLVRFPRDPLFKLVSLHVDAMLEGWVNLDLDAAGTAAERAMEIARTSGIDLLNGMLRFFGIQVALGRGDMPAARRLLEPWHTEVIGAPPAVVGPYEFVCGWEAFERGDVSGCERHLEASLRHAETLGATVPIAVTRAGLVICAATRGDVERTAWQLRELDAIDDPHQPRPLTRIRELSLAYAGVCFGDASSEQLGRALRGAVDEGLSPFVSYSQLVTRRLVVAALEQHVAVEAACQLIRTCKLQPGPDVLASAAWPWPIRVRAFGALRIECEGRPLQFGRKAPAVPLTLLQVLAGQAEPVRSQHLMAMIWPGYKGRAPRGTLDTAAYRLRKLLGNDAAVTQAGGCLALDGSLCWTDVAAFRLVCERIQALALACAPGAPVAGASAPRRELERQETQLLALYTAPFAAADDLPTLRRIRDALARRWVRTNTTLAQLWSAFGETERATRALQRSRVEPLHIGA